MLFSSCCLVASLGRQTIFRLTVLGAVFLVSGRFTGMPSGRDSEPTCSIWKPSQVHQCKCLPLRGWKTVQGALWSHIHGLFWPLHLHQDSPVSATCERMCLEFFLCKVLVRGNLNWSSCYNPVSIFTTLALMWSYNIHIQMLKTDLFFFFFLNSSHNHVFWRDQFPELTDTVIAFMWAQENGRENGGRQDNGITASRAQFGVGCLLGCLNRLHLWCLVKHKSEDNLCRRVQQKNPLIDLPSQWR